MNHLNGVQQGSKYMLIPLESRSYVHDIFKGILPPIGYKSTQYFLELNVELYTAFFSNNFIPNEFFILFFILMQTFVEDHLLKYCISIT